MLNRQRIKVNNCGLISEFILDIVGSSEVLDKIKKMLKKSQKKH